MPSSYTKSAGFTVNIYISKNKRLSLAPKNLEIVTIAIKTIETMAIDPIVLIPKPPANLKGRNILLNTKGGNNKQVKKPIIIYTTNGKS